MSDKIDDLEAVRRLVEVLSPFETVDQERIIRWAREKLGLSTDSIAMVRNDDAGDMTESASPGGLTDIKTFVTDKNPTSDNQFAAAVAYYYRFIAPQAARKDSITADDLQQACRLAGRSRLARPGQTLINAHTNGLLDKGANRGEYTISTVGENLVAVTMPGSISNTGSRSRPPASRKTGARRGARAGHRKARKSHAKRS